jgi:hypothetical protein
MSKEMVPGNWEVLAEDISKHVGVLSRKAPLTDQGWVVMLRSLDRSFASL